MNGLKALIRERYTSVGFMYHYDTLSLAISITYSMLIFLFNKKNGQK